MSTAALLRAPGLRPNAPLDMLVKRSAAVSECGLYRWAIRRWWMISGEPQYGNVLPWIMLNPSTADGRDDDPTLKRIMGWTWRWGFDGLLVVNLYPFRSSKPTELAEWCRWDKRQDWYARDRLHENWDRAARLLKPFDAAMVAWDSPGGYLAFETEMVAEGFFDTVNSPDGPRERSLDSLFCLGLTQGGDPIHPMARGRHRVPDAALPQVYPGQLGTVHFGPLEAA